MVLFRQQKIDIRKAGYLSSIVNTIHSSPPSLDRQREYITSKQWDYMLVAPAMPTVLPD